MRPIGRPGPALESLERRDCPALTLQYFSSGLFIKGTPTGDLAVTGTAAPNTFTVTDAGKSLGSYALNANLSISLASRPGAIRIDLNGNSIGGNVLIDQGNGYTGSAPLRGPVDLFDSTAVGGLSTGTVLGNVTVVDGNGGELIELGIATDPVLGTADILPITVRGGVTAVGRANANKIDGLVIGDGSQVGGDVSATQIDNVNLGLQSVATPGFTRVAGSVSVTTAGVSSGLRVNLVGSFGKSVTVNGSATTSFSNGFTLEPPDPGVDSVIAGNLSVSFGQAAFGNQFNILIGTGSQTSRVGGAVQLTSTNGFASLPDRFVVEGAVGGSLNLRSGQAASEFSFADTAEVGGDLRYTGGNGSNRVGAAGLFANVFAGSVAGSLYVALGNGANLVDLQTGVGGKVIFRGGNGSNTLNLAPASAARFALDAVFGTGTNVLDLNNGGTVTLTGRIEGTGGSNTFDSDGAILQPPLLLIRFP